MIPISICIIAKNEEQYISECLRRLTAYDWEIVVVDTGSTDRTVEIAREYTPNVFHFDWINDFSAARNYCISKASNDYILVVDCDEYLEADAQTSHFIGTLTQQITSYQVGMLTLLSPVLETETTAGDTSSPSVVHEHIARFFHKQYVRYQGSIHEQLVAKNGNALTFVQIPLTFYHAGYNTIDIRKEKTSRNIPLLEAALQKNGADPYILFQLGQSYFGLFDYERALTYFEKALALDVNEQEDYVQTLIESYGYCLVYLKRFNEALGLQGVYPYFSKRADFVFLMGLIYMNNALFEQAIEEFLKATTISDYAVDGVNSYKAYYNTGVIYECSGNIADAIKYYKKCGDYAPATERLKSLPELLR